MTSLSSIRIHPVKSTAIRLVGEADVDALGLVGDRRWMVVDGDGECVTARTDRRLFTIVADTAHTAPGLPVPLRLSAPGFGAIDVPVSGSEAIRVTVFGRALRARSASPEVRHWLQAVLQRRDVDLVQMVEPRPLNPAYAEAGEATAFADGYPVTLASESSLRQLRDWIGEGAQSALPMDRFRPNLVVTGDVAPFAEDTWRRVRIGAITFRVVKGIDRCAMTLLDPATLVSGAEPIHTLARYRKWDGATWFGVQLIPDNPGSILVGDSVTPT